MPKLYYNLDDIKDFDIEPGRYKARLVKVESGVSKAKKPMLVWHWRIISKEEKGKETRSWTSLAPNAMGNLKMHLEAFGFSGEVKTHSKRLIGKKVILAMGLTISVNKAGVEREFSNVVAVLPYSKSAKTGPSEDFEDEYEDEDEDEYEDEDDDEDEYEDGDEDEDEDEDDEDWEEDEDEEEDEEGEDEEPEPTPRKKKKKKKSRQGKLPF